jgi:hypothetical protein
MLRCQFSKQNHYRRLYIPSRDAAGKPGRDCPDKRDARSAPDDVIGTFISVFQPVPINKLVLMNENARLSPCF